MIEPKKILVIRFSAIGDIILTSPLLRVLRKRFPKAEIHFLTKSQNADLVRYNPNINRVLLFHSEGESLGKIISQVRQEEYDWIIDIHKNIRSRIIRCFGKAKRSTTYKKLYWRRFLLIKFKYRLKKPIQHVIDKYFYALRRYKLENDNLGTEVFCNNESIKEVEKLIQHLPQKPIIAICPGASYATKRWTEEGFKEVANKLIKEGNQIIFIGGKQDIDLCERLANSTNSNSYAGKLKLLESAYLLKKSSLAITNDSGMMHLAQSQNTPVVAIFGSTTKDLGFFPTSQNSKVVENKKLSCRPCHSKGTSTCPKQHFKCMYSISSKDVILSIKYLEL